MKSGWKKVYRPSGRNMKLESNPNWKGGSVEKNCERCHKPFTVKYTRKDSARFCSLGCVNAWQREARPNLGKPTKEYVSTKCLVCGAAMRVQPSRADRLRTCSPECSRRFIRVRLSSPKGIYSNRKIGKRADLGNQFFRSSWEANYARYLNLLVAQKTIDRWEYEPDTFWFEAIRRGVRSYTPDFKVFERAAVYYVEVKGWMDPKSKTKIKRMAKYHPAIELRVVDAKAYKALARQISAAIPEWEGAA